MNTLSTMPATTIHNFRTLTDIGATYVPVVQNTRDESYGYYKPTGAAFTRFGGVDIPWVADDDTAHVECRNEHDMMAHIVALEPGFW